LTIQLTPHGNPADQDLAVRPLVLVVHRSPTVRHAMLVTLDLDGFDVLVAGDGAEAAALLVEIRPRAVVVDLDAHDEHIGDLLGLLRSDGDTASVPVIDFGGNTRPLPLASAGAGGTHRVPRADSLMSLLTLLRQLATDRATVRGARHDAA
jgi:CheY-like chemotaxis protein